MVKKKKNKLDYVAAANSRRIVIRAPSPELKQEFERIAAELNRSTSNLGWHQLSEFMRQYKAKIKEPQAA